jgi:arsenate reductase
MAEGLVNHFLSAEWQAYSAGTEPTGYMHPLAVRVMAELGIDISGQRSKSVDEFRDAEERCPTWLGSGQREHIGFADPAAVQGSEAQQLHAFRQVRDEIRQKILI